MRQRRVLWFAFIVLGLGASVLFGLLLALGQPFGRWWWAWTAIGGLVAFAGLVVRPALRGIAALAGVAAIVSLTAISASLFYLEPTDAARSIVRATMLAIGCVSVVAALVAIGVTYFRTSDVVRIVIKVGLVVASGVAAFLMIQTSRVAPSQPPYPSDSEADADVDVLVQRPNNRVDVIAIYSLRDDARYEVEYFLSVPGDQPPFRFFLVLNGDQATVRDDYAVQGNLRKLTERQTRESFGRTGRLQVFEGQYGGEPTSGRSGGSTLADSCRRVEAGVEVTEFGSTGTFSLSGDTYASPFDASSP